MKKKIMWGSVLIALLMLVTTQIVFLNTVRSSDPSAHEGDADVGDLWIDELDVSSDLTTMDYIGIGHANATDDWVIWTDGTGNINASWDVDIAAGDHPEYYVLICMVIYNVDDNNSEMGNDTFSKTYTAGLGYDESGTLSVAVEFTQQQQQAGSQTLVCYVSACARINDTTEAKNFTSWGHDRCIVAVDFSDPGDQPLFPTYRKKANEDFPNIWSWINGWDESSRFANEDDMLESQTYFTAGGNGADESYSWKIGEFDLHLYLGGGVSGSFKNRQRYPHMKFDSSGLLYVDSYAPITYTDHGAILPATLTNYVLTHEGQGSASSRTYMPQTGQYPDDEIGVDFKIDEDDDEGSDNKINVWGFAWAARPTAVVIWGLLYQIQIDEGTTSSQSVNGVSGLYWEESCAYFNYTHSLSVSSSTQSGITTVTVDISDVLDSDDEFIYTFAGENGDERIQISC
jgi:hypothetical protein